MGCCQSRDRRMGQDPRGEETGASLSISYLLQGIIDQSQLNEVTKGEMGKSIHRHIGPIIFKNQSDSLLGRGTGVLISPNLVLTAAQNVWSRRTKNENIELTFHPGQHGQLREGKKVERIFYPQGYQNKESVEEDYAFLKLAQITEADGFLSLGQILNQKVALAIYGYPEQYYKTQEVEDKKKNKKTVEKVNQWGLIKNEAIKQVGGNRQVLIHDIPIQKGQGGAPIISIVGTQLRIVGISKGSISQAKGGQKTLKNVGRLITPQLVEQLKAEATKMDATMCNLDSSLKKDENQRVSQMPNNRPQQKALQKNDIIQQLQKDKFFDYYASRDAYEARDKHIFLEVDFKDSQSISKVELERWATNVCVAAFSSSFNYYETEQMTFDQAKIFSSETILGNILRLTEKYKLGEQQVSIIDNHLKNNVLEYMANKYPLSLSVDVNKALQKELQKTNNLDELDNDFLYSNRIVFKYREDGNYNDIIMTVMNRLMEITEEQVIDEINFDEDEDTSYQDITTYQSFQNNMTLIFEKVYDEEWMLGKSPLRKKKPKDSDQNHEKSKQADKLKYKEKVKKYTKFKIGRKISQNATQYTKKEIQGKNLVIKSSAVLRILTKWCEQLWDKFEKENYFAERAEPVLLEDMDRINPFFKWMKADIDKRMKAEKEKILEFRRKLESDCHLQESIVLNKYLEEDSVNYIPKYEKAYGKFATHMVKNLHSYIIQTLNRMIHGLLYVSKEFYKKNIDGKDWQDWNSPPFLITFKIGDMVRCKCSSKESQIIMILRHLTQISKEEPERLKIIRIKNRLRLGTNDILINAKFNEEVLCQMQLQVNNSEQSKFITCANAFSHYIYELARSLFGPISELCNIWNNLDARAHAFESLINNKLKAYDPFEILAIPSCDKYEKHQYKDYLSPFECSICKNFYFHNNYIISNKQCQHCLQFECVRCQIKSLNNSELKDKIFRDKRDKKIKEACNKLSSKNIPAYGVCFRLDTNEPKLEMFHSKKVESKNWLFGKNEKGELYEIHKVSSKGQVLAFMREYCIFSLVKNPNQFIKIGDKDAFHYSMKAYVKDCYFKEKESMILSQIKFNAEEMKKLLEFTEDFSEQRQLITKMEYVSNNIDDISYLSIYPNLTSLNLDFNTITDISVVTKWPGLTHLSLRDNKKLEVIGDEIGQLTDLEELKLSNCAITKISDQIEKLTAIDVIKLDKNMLTSIPNALCKNEGLWELNLSRNQIKQLPSKVSGLGCLRKLYMAHNQLQKLPKDFTELEQLNVLSLSHNKLKKIPENFNKFKSLQKLELNGNALSDLPENCFAIKKIKSINLEQNKLIKFTCNMKECKSLEFLSLSSNKLFSLTSSISHCSNLVNLNLDGNQFETIPACLAELKKLSNVFNFKNNELKEIPNYFFKLDWIVEANFENNKIQTIHPDLVNMSILEKINLSNNRIASINEEFRDLTYLTFFSFKGNSISNIPDFMLDFNYVSEKPSNLDTVFSTNHISELKSPFIEMMGENIRLTHNYLRSMPILQIQDKRGIKVMDFSSNKITEIPKEIVQFFNLTTLTLSDNLINVVPKELEKLEHLANGSLSLQHNPLGSIECEAFFLQKAHSNTKYYLKNKKSEDEKKGKAVLTGLLSAMQNPDPDPEEEPEPEEESSEEDSSDYDIGDSFDLQFNSDDYNIEISQDDKEEEKKQEQLKKEKKEKVEREH